MDVLDPARVIVVKAIAILENAIEALMSRQAPGSTQPYVRQAADQMRTIARRLIQQAQAIEAALEGLEQGDG